MNKKFTMAVASLLLSSAFSVYAANSSNKIGDYTKGEAVSVADFEKGGSFFLKFGDKYLASDWETGTDKKEVKYFTIPSTENFGKKEDLNNYLWTVTAAPQYGGKTGYVFANKATGKKITFSVEGEDVTARFTLISEVDKLDKAVSTVFFFGKNGDKYNASDDMKVVLPGYGNDDYLNFKEAELPTEVDKLEILANQNDPTSVDALQIEALKDGLDITDPSELNDLYNSAGFNFALNDDKLEGVGNIFADKRIVALKVGKVVADEVEAVGNGDNAFPAGTYFATSVPYKWNYSSNPYVNSYDYLTQCTFIAVDSDNNISDEDAVADNMKAGKGFTLTEVSGKDLVLYQGEEDKFKAQGNQIAVCNAVFKVQESTTEDVYKLTVPTVRALEKSGSTNQVENNDLGITAAKGDSQISTGTASFIFKFAESTVEKGISFLKTDGPAIYNIKFYLSNGADDTYNGKYLTVAANGTDYVAKGAVLADLDAPAYQWLITKVDGSNVTFTNREGTASFTTQLFKEDGGRYSLALEDNNLEFKYYNVDENGDVVLGTKNTTSTDGKSVSLDRRFVVLEESKAVNFSDYLDVEDETLMTLSFGRDIAPTSNKLYPIVTEVSNGVYKFCDNSDKFPHRNLTDDINLAAQWLLVKVKDNGVAKTNPIKRNYAYANGDLVNIKNNGDVVYAYSYKLQLVLDGKAIENQYLIEGTEGRGQGYTIGANGDVFFIQENEDGSVLLKSSRRDANALFLGGTYDNNGDKTGPKTIGELIDTYFKPSGIDDLVDNEKVLSRATDVKTYLIAEAPAVSLPGNEGHYSIASTDGNYITMNDERDAMTVKEASEPLYLYVTDKKDVVPSFYVTKAAANKAERMFLFNPQDSINYYVGEGKYDKTYQLVGGQPKAIFKAAAINETRDTLTTNIKGVSTLVAVDANNTNKVSGGLDRFKMQIVESADADGTYVIRQKKGDWLQSINGALVWGNKVDAMKFDIEGAEAPTSNESVAASEVKVIANNGSINVKNAAGKNVVVSTILGQVVANEVLTSDNATINVPAGIVVVAVEGESFKINVR